MTVTTLQQPARARASLSLGREKAITIKTPEGIAFSLVIASPISRFLALAIDQACIYIISMMIGIILRLLGLISYDVAGGLVIISSFVISTGYPIACEWYWRGQTLGKKALRIRVMDEQGLRLKFSQIVVRNLLRVLDMLPGLYLVGGVSSFVSPRGQRVGDIAANTIVIQHPAVSEPDLDQLNRGKFNSFRDHPHLAARLRQNVTPAEAGIAMQALLRREILDPAQRLRLFSMIRSHMEQITRFPPETVEGMSDEQYIRNVLDIVFG